MTLADYYFVDPRIVLVPIEHLTEAGMSREFAAEATARRGWSRERIALFDTGFALYWARSDALARRTPTWPAPRLRHVAVVAEPRAVRPYVQLLNTSAWTLYELDLDPAASHPELVAFLLVLGDRMAASGEVATAALHAGAYWFDRSDDERAAFVAAVARSRRPDAEALRLLAHATDWLRELHHETLRPPATGVSHRSIPGTGLLVPRAREAEPPLLVASWTEVARRALGDFRAAWRGSDALAARTLCDWLATEAPRLLVTTHGGRIVWDPENPARLGALRHELRQADGAAVRAVTEDLRVIDRHTRAFRAALVDPAGLPAPDPSTEQSGYCYLHRERPLVAYNLREPGMERLQGPDLPYARAMLGARAVHEWAHLAVTAGWVPQMAPPAEFATRTEAFAEQMEAVISAAPAATREVAAADLRALTVVSSGAAPIGAEPGGASRGMVQAGTALTRLLLTRMPDYQANLVARRFLDSHELETYVRHNVRTLRADYPPARLWRMLVRYLYEYQYLSFSAVGDPRTYFLRSTWFEEDFVATGVLDADRFDALAHAVAALCGSYAVDESRFRPSAQVGRGLIED